jgi:hypothetical protein
MRQILACLIAFAACGKSDPKPGPDRSVPQAVPAQATPTPTADTGSCTLTASGGYAGTATGPGDRGSVGTKFWSGAQAADDMHMHMPAVVVSCHASPDLRLTIASKRDDNVVFGPKTYTVVADDADFGISGRAGSGILKLVGTIDITAFDRHHIAGTVDVTGPLIKGGASVTLKGSFDYPCHASGC